MKTRTLLLVAAMCAVLLPATTTQARSSDTITTISDSRSSGSTSEMATAPDGRRMIAYSNYRVGTIELFICENSSCSQGRVAPIPVGFWGPDFDFAVGSDGLPVFVFANNDPRRPPTVKIVKCNDIYCEDRVNSDLWSANDYRSAGVGDISIDVDHRNNPIVVFSAANGPDRSNATTVVSCGSPDCISKDNRFRVGPYAVTHDVAIGPNGFPVIALDPVNGDKYMTLERCNDRRCNTREREEIGSGGATTPRLASDGTEITVVAIDTKDRAERTVCSARPCSGHETISQNGVHVVTPNVAYVKPGASAVSYTDHHRGDLWLDSCARTCNGRSLVQASPGLNYTRVGIIGRDGRAYISFQTTSQRQLTLADVGAT